MICPNCAAPLTGASPLCPRCGHPILEDDRTVRLSFDGDVVEVLGWFLLFIVSAIVVIPLAWTMAAFCRWFGRNLRFSDGTTAEFTGTGPEVLGWILLSVLVSAVSRIPGWLHADTIVQILVGLPGFFVGVLIDLYILRWLVSSIRLSSGPPLEFDGDYAGYLGYHFLIALSVLTIIGWAWVLAGYSQWLAEHTRGKDIAIRFQGTGWEILWRTVLAVLGSLLIVTIPWMWTWWTRWVVSCVTMTREAALPRAA